jgi:uncharacterized protein YqgC (DUF456 family)
MTVIDVAWIAGLLAVNALGVFLVALALPGTWLIVLATGLFAWLRGYPEILGWPSLSALIGLAVLGEVVEFAAGAAGVKSAGGTKRGAAGAIAGGIVGAIAGTFLIPIPVLGSVLGAAMGSFVGALLGERSAGRTSAEQLQAAQGAFWGRLLGTVSKLAIAVVMWILVASALFL